VADVLGPEANYFDPRAFERSLGEQLSLFAQIPRAELHRRGALIQERVLEQFSWEAQGRRLAVFLESVCTGRSLASAA